MKCLPRNHVRLAKGNTLHDSHAEVLVLRAFNRLLLEECRRLLEAPMESQNTIVQWRRAPNTPGSSTDGPPFTIRHGTRIIMYSSEAPCGDASMELIIEKQGDPTPWMQTAAETSESSAQDPALFGRGYFSQLGVVRRKPARPDAPETFSKSCSDKLAMKQCSSVLSSITSPFIYPGSAYIHTLVIPESQYRPEACSRAFGPDGRLRPIVGDGVFLEDGYSFSPYSVQTTSHEFEWSRRSIPTDYRPSACNTALIATATSHEVIVGGTLQGRKQFNPRGASKVSRRSMWTLAATVARLLHNPMIDEAMAGPTYANLKSSELLLGRRELLDVVKSKALSGWIPNDGDEDFSLQEK
ncbi:hypothetical protein P152DRAFT_478906 [Eremomyces bilateralis CBS 781.70]|uniref:A to I editase domain-containing protein n=1 Tax=Eremomyces bilateralis CBS 781.70 TaxID=1392243 RepID=A0A6G1GE96_9PEZI|nr:uncharacterized protein P152DRAFT_478906 [Eremomyces bilateralis CBS 781.70]KAF1816352.1 hypothetical protein P152DRAFT_478906 [Eremomyces bilateralis CBS 781.70]